MVMRVYDGELGLEGRLLVPIQPILAHGASRRWLLRGCSERKDGRRAAGKSNELASLHGCPPVALGEVTSFNRKRRERSSALARRCNRAGSRAARDFVLRTLR